jgi:hypothetical protein
MKVMTQCSTPGNAGRTAAMRKRPPGRLPLLVRVQQFAALTQARRHLAACRMHLSPDLLAYDGSGWDDAPSPSLSSRELERALEVAAQLGQHLQAKAPFWRELKLAAQQLNLSNLAACCAWHERASSL